MPDPHIPPNDLLHALSSGSRTNPSELQSINNNVFQQNYLKSVSYEKDYSLPCPLGWGINHKTDQYTLGNTCCVNPTSHTYRCDWYSAGKSGGAGAKQLTETKYGVSWPLKEIVPGSTDSDQSDILGPVYGDLEMPFKHWDIHRLL